MSVPHTPTASVSTSTAPSDSGGSSMSSRRAEPAVIGFTVSAFKPGPSSLVLHLWSFTLGASISMSLAGVGAPSPGFALPRPPLPQARRPQTGHGRRGFHIIDLGVPAQVVGGVHERHVGEGLGEVSDLSFGHGVVLLGQESEVVAETDETIEKSRGVVVASEQEEAVGE